MDNTRKFLIEHTKYGIFEVLIDEEDWPEVKKYKWHANKNVRCTSRDVFYVTTSLRKGERKNWEGRQAIGLHTLITKCSKGKEVDHINHDPLDNRRSNLRVCTRSQNGKNTFKKIGDYIGTRFKSHSKRRANAILEDLSPWEAAVVVNGENIHIGRYTCEEAAALARDEKVLSLPRKTSSFYSLNFPNGASQQIVDIIEAANEKAQRLLAKRKEEQTSKYIGVFKSKQNLKKRWLAKISFNNRSRNLGYYETEEEAAIARDKKAIELRGDKAKLNFPREHKNKQRN